jgi:carboxylate-amine ligase
VHPPRPPLTEETARAAFEGVSRLTVGVEDEVMLLHPETDDLLPADEGVLARIADDGRFRREFVASQLEIGTGVCRGAGAAAEELRGNRRALRDLLDGAARLAAAGTHPFAAAVGQLTPGPRFAALADAYRWAAPRALVSAMHIHVAVPGADRALAVHNALRSFLPELAALAGNAPFHEGRDTGLSSLRPKLCEGLPRQGLPPAFASWSDLVAFVAWGREGGLFPDASQLWWELRLHPYYGTLEVRVPDAQTTPDDCAGVIAAAHGLVAWLVERHEAGEELPVHDGARIAENRQRALRYGLHGTMADLDTGEPRPTRERLVRLLELIGPAAERAGSGRELALARAMLTGNGADRQRALAGELGVRGMTRRLSELFCG